MSARKNRSRNTYTVRKGSVRKHVKDKIQVRKDAVAKSDNVKAKVTSEKKFVQSNPMMLQAEFSTILKEPGDELQEDVEEESFNPPLHSTALDDDDFPEKTKIPNENVAKLTSPGPSVSLQKSMRENRSALKNKTIASKKPNLTAPNLSLEKAQQTGQKRTPVEDDSPEQSSSSKIAKAQTSQSSSRTTPAKNKKSPGNIKATIKEKSTPKRRKSKKADGEDVVKLKIWSPEDVPRTARDINELDVILYESEKIVERFRELTNTDASRNAVDGFFCTFKDQLTNSMKDVQMLVNLKRKNAKVQTEIGRKQKRLIEVRDEIIKKQPILNQLQKECSEAEKRQKFSHDAKKFLGNLEQLQEDYRIFKAEKPKIKETYGLSSLPACLFQAQTTLRAEQHFHNVNTQLQSVLNKITEKR